MFTKDKIEAIDHKNPPKPHTPEALAKLNADQAAKDAAAKPVPPVAVTPSPKP
jgi:hypothetical protein